MTNVLFVCSANRLRSPTAEQVFSTWPGIETDSAGISAGATVLLTSEQIDWADIIFVMEKTHRSKLTRASSRHQLCPPPGAEVSERHISTGMIRANTSTSLNELAQNENSASEKPTPSAASTVSG